jgi:hypothetical protein
LFFDFFAHPFTGTSNSFTAAEFFYQTQRTQGNLNPGIKPEEVFCIPRDLRLHPAFTNAMA